MNFRQQLDELPAATLVSMLETVHGVRISLVGNDPYVFGPKSRSVAAIVKPHQPTMRAELIAARAIRNAQLNARLVRR